MTRPPTQEDQMLSKTDERLIRELCREKGYSIRNGRDELRVRDERPGYHAPRYCYLARNDYRKAFEAVIAREAGRERESGFVWTNK